MDKPELDKIIERENELWFRPWIEEPKMKELLTRQNRPLIKELGRAPMPSEYGDLTYVVFGDYTNGKEHDVIVFSRFEGDKLSDSKAPLLRVHSSCRSSELFHASNCECREELDLAMKTMAKEKKGIIIYLNQEGAGNGIAAKLATYKNSFIWKDDKVVLKIDEKTNKPTDVYQEYVNLGYPNENRDFTVAVEILKSFGIKNVRLMTNNPSKIEGLKAHGLNVEPVGIHVKPANEIVKRHLKAKKEKLGHNI